MWGLYIRILYSINFSSDNYLDNIHMVKEFYFERGVIQEETNISQKVIPFVNSGVDYPVCLSLRST